MKQIHDKPTFTSIKKIKITQKQSSDVLWKIMLLKEKQCGDLKGPMCAYVRKHRKTSKKLDATFPTAAT